MTPEVTLSVVSHGQGELVAALIADLERCVTTPIRVILTENVPDSRWSRPGSGYPFEIEVIENRVPKGFGANHNAALTRARTSYFCILNPDIRLVANPFPLLCDALADGRIGVAAPLVTNSGLEPEDHAREFPSVFTLFAKALGSRPSTPPPVSGATYYPDWIAGMFMLFRSETLRSLGGFDEKYFLYYEDVDLCARLRERDLEVAVCPAVSVIHAARRASRRNLRYAYWHLSSAVRFFVSRPAIALGLHRRRSVSGI